MILKGYYVDYSYKGYDNETGKYKIYVSDKEYIEDQKEKENSQKKRPFY